MHIPFLMSLTVILLGYFLKRIGFLEAEHSRLLSKMVMNITFPAQILVTISTAPLSTDLFILPWIPIFSAIIGFSLGLILFRKLPSDTKGLMLMATMGLNIGLFAFPILQGLFGDLVLPARQHFHHLTSLVSTTRQSALQNVNTLHYQLTTNGKS
ncbi:MULTISPECIES: AEC family transporter [unclassified Oceanispirochaeta]|uniref:AEC family transporter n=1 Tax=unclassified Oceanispirochaeta TaxID=2635722 RepID=UPI000E09C78C|nr:MULTISPECIES: AEC family transporter [unclassified Oceanispirochaeta]MBF9018915.1 AEC family transporter [Oceanispirochaeta sp. M2]NPD75414.1 hypothetical protein [Oceanispirochaeta sp. M1]RDG28738.1 hypothetical protein DV872_25310 [Oceanispirochaeta sp. M1]